MVSTPCTDNSVQRRPCPSSSTFQMQQYACHIAPKCHGMGPFFGSGPFSLGHPPQTGPRAPAQPLQAKRCGYYTTAAHRGPSKRVRQEVSCGTSRTQLHQSSAHQNTAPRIMHQIGAVTSQTANLPAPAGAANAALPCRPHSWADGPNAPRAQGTFLRAACHRLGGSAFRIGQA